MPASFPHTRVKAVESWSNYSGTISRRAIPVYCTPLGGTDIGVLRKHGDALRAILAYCFEQEPPATLRTLGSKWSFSNVIEPGRVALDTANFTYMRRIPQQLFSDGYRTRSAQGFTPVFVEGGTQIASVNRRLARDLRLSLQTSGAGDGHRMAGCIATGTHGSALGIGALHDTVLGLYLVVAPERALFVQSGTSPFSKAAIAGWLEERTGIPTSCLADDAAFRASLVALGSLGVVFGVVVETVPLYRLQFKRVGCAFGDPRLWRAIETLDTGALHPDHPARPYHFDVVLHPYPSGGGESAAFATMMWKSSAEGVPPPAPLPTVPLASSDLMGLIAKLAQLLGNSLSAPLALPVLQGIIDDQLRANAVPAAGEAFPAELFGQTSLPPGTGASTEIVVDQREARRALETVYAVLDRLKTQGRFLLGVIGVRFVPATRAWLGMNIAPMNCYIELPSVRNANVLELYTAIWNELERAGIRFTCHWGQLHGMTPARLARYFGDRAAAWKAARAVLLDAKARQVFAAPILREAGLDG